MEEKNKTTTKISLFVGQYRVSNLQLIGFPWVERKKKWRRGIIKEIIQKMFQN